MKLRRTPLQAVCFQRLTGRGKIEDFGSPEWHSVAGAHIHGMELLIYPLPQCRLPPSINVNYPSGHIRIDCGRRTALTQWCHRTVKQVALRPDSKDHAVPITRGYGDELGASPAGSSNSGVEHRSLRLLCALAQPNTFTSLEQMLVCRGGN